MIPSHTAEEFDAAVTLIMLQRGIRPSHNPKPGRAPLITDAVAEEISHLIIQNDKVCVDVMLEYLLKVHHLDVKVGTLIASLRRHGWSKHWHWEKSNLEQKAQSKFTESVLVMMDAMLVKHNMMTFGAISKYLANFHGLNVKPAQVGEMVHRRGWVRHWVWLRHATVGNEVQEQEPEAE